MIFDHENSAHQNKVNIFSSFLAFDFYIIDSVDTLINHLNLPSRLFEKKKKKRKMKLVWCFLIFLHVCIVQSLQLPYLALDCICQFVYLSLLYFFSASSFIPSQFYFRQREEEKQTGRAKNQKIQALSPARAILMGNCR